jgi:co-chaperonin GroES (HSP10)
LKLNNSLVLIRVDETPETNLEGIYIQEEWRRVPQTGTVEFIADDVEFCQVGDHVEFERYGAIEVSTDENLRLCREDAVLMVL